MSKTKTKTTSPPEQTPDQEPEAVMHVEGDSAFTDEQPAVLRVDAGDDSWSGPIPDMIRDSYPAIEEDDDEDEDEDDESTPSLVREGFSPDGIAKMLDLQGDWTNRLIGRTPDHWRWTDEEKRVVADCSSRISARSKMLRRAAQAEDAVVLVGALGSYIVRNALTAATADRVAAQMIGGHDAQVETAGTRQADHEDGAGAGADDPFAAV